MATASVSEKAWLVSENDRAISLLVHLRQRSYVLPWSLFLFAEGNDGEVRATFHTHIVLLEGDGLTSLLTDLAAQTVTELKEPDRADKFSEHKGSHIATLSVTENK
jgi:hypothetical protein